MTEKEVNKAALSALRSYYRFRIKSGSPEVISDIRGAGGIIADGSYAFQTPEGDRFLATVEATSHETRDEVYFKLQRWLLIWDSSVFASIMMLVIFGWAYLSGWYWLLEYGWIKTIFLLLVIALILGIIYFRIFEHFRRYRYIYAVEQFKRYHADEQWIAIADNVFEQNNDRYYAELRNQCIYNGFGLIVVDQTLRPHLAITPARREIFGGTRQIVQFFSKSQITRLIQRGGNIQEWWKKFSKGIPLQWKTSDPEYFLRFRRSVWNQIILCSISWLMIGGIVYDEWQDRPLRYVGQEVYESEVVTRQVQSEPEPRRPIIPIGDSLYIEPFDNKVIPYLLLLQIEKVSPSIVALDLKDNEVLIGMFENVLIEYDCERLYNFKKPKYILQEGIYPDFESLMARMNQLMAAGMEVNSLWLGCFTENDQRYILYFGLMLDQMQQSQNALEKYSNQLKDNQINATISIKTLMPKR